MADSCKKYVAFVFTCDQKVSALRANSKSILACDEETGKMTVKLMGKSYEATIIGTAGE
jgi:hypothetical protein